MSSPNDHTAFYVEGAPIVGDAAELDTGLRCHCGLEVVNTMNDLAVRSGWAHVGVGDKDDRTREGS